MRRHDRRAVSSVIGAFFFVLVAFGAFATLLFAFNSVGNFGNTAKAAENQLLIQKETSLGATRTFIGAQVLSGSLSTNAATAGGTVVITSNQSIGTTRPATVDTSTSPLSTSFSELRKVVWSAPRWWVFYTTAKTDYNTNSSSAMTWAGGATVDNQGFGSTYTTWLTPGSSTFNEGFLSDTAHTYFTYGSGTMNSGGTISGVSSVSPTTSYSIVGTKNPIPTFLADSVITNGTTTWMSVDTFGTAGAADPFSHDIQVYKCPASCTTAANWALAKDTPFYGVNATSVLVPLKSGVALIYGEGRVSAPIYITSTTNGGATWSVPVSPPSSYAMLFSSATAIGNAIYFAGRSGVVGGYGVVRTFSWNLGSSATSPEVVLDSRSAPWSVSISQAGNTLVVVYGAGTPSLSCTGQCVGGIFYAYTTDDVTWYSIQALGGLSSTTDANIQGLTTSYISPSGMVGVLWLGGTSSPFSVRFAQIGCLDPSADCRASTKAIPSGTVGTGGVGGTTNVIGISVVNSSPFAVHLVSFYVADSFGINYLAYNTLTSPAFNIYLAPGATVNVVAAFNWVAGTQYAVTVTTDTGIVFTSHVQA